MVDISDRLLSQGERHVGKYITVMHQSDKDKSDRGKAYVYVRGYTACIGSLNISQSKDFDDFYAKGVTVPLRIIPTIEGLGVMINDRLIERDKLSGDYSVVIPTGEHLDGSVNFHNKLQFESSSAEYRIGGQSVIHYYWAQDDGKAEAKRRSVVRRVNVFDQKAKIVSNVHDDPYLDEKANGKELTRFSIYNAPTIDTQDETNTHPVYLQVEQNGMRSPVYTVNVNRSSKDVIVGVEEIPVEDVLGAENEAEAVYYNLNGVKVNAERLEKGIYIKVQGNKSEKVLVR